MKSIALVSLFGFAAFLTLMAVSSQLWLDPLTPLLIGLAGIALPMLIAVAVMEPGFRKMQVEIVALTFACAIFLGVALPGLWFKGEFRIHAVGLSSLKNIELVLDDPYLPIQEAGCAQAFELNMSADDIVRLVQDKPQIAAACLDRADVGNIPVRLANHWRFDLNLGTSCDLTEPLKTLKSLTVEERATEFLDCALQADHKEVRSCCTTALRELIQGEQLADMVMKSSNEFHRRGLLDELVLLTHEETETMKNYDGESIKAAGLTTPEFQAATLQAGCRAVLTESSPSSLSSAMRWTLDQHIGCVTNPLHLELTPLVFDVCFDFVESQTSLDAYCALNRTHRAKRLEAKEVAEQARPPSDFGEIADSISSGHARSTNVTLDNYLDTVSQARDGRPVGQYSTAQQAALRQNLESMRPQVARPAEVSGELRGAENRMDQLQKNPELMRLMQNQDPAEVDQIRKGFEARAKRSRKRTD